MTKSDCQTRRPDVATAVPLKGRLVEDQYIADNPDVADAIKHKKFKGAVDHFEAYGAFEMRHPEGASHAFDYRFESCRISARGDLFFSGWMDDRFIKCQNLAVQLGYSSLTIPVDRISRYHRNDVSRHLGIGPAEWPASFWCATPTEKFFHGSVSGIGGCYLGNSLVHAKLEARALSCERMLLSFSTLLSSMSNPLTHLLCAADAESLATIRALWLRHLESATRFQSLTVGRPSAKRPRLSLITVLYGSHDLIQVQAALLWQRLEPDVEIIVVCNSPEIAGSLERAAQAIHACYGCNLQLLIMSGNCGFGMANNIAADHARGSALAFVNPDVLPHGSERETRLLDAAEHAKEQRHVIGPCLFYGSGAVMHAGMDIISEPVVGSDVATALRVHHRSKGIPGAMAESLAPSPVPAVTGGLLIIGRSEFEELGGFRSDYVFGHYEDADLCLRAWESRMQVWFDPALRFVHLEGEGSKGEGFSTGISHYNRAQFTRHWSDQLAGTLERVGAAA